VPSSRNCAGQFRFRMTTGRAETGSLISPQPRRKTEQLYPLDFALYEWQLARLEEGISARYGASVDAAA